LDLLAVIRSNVQKAMKSMKEAQEKQARAYNRKHRQSEGYIEGDLVMLEAEGISWKANSKRPEVNLPTMLGPFRVLEVLDDATNVLLELPRSMSRVHPVFPIPYVRHYRAPTEHFPSRQVWARPAPVLGAFGDELFEVEKILAKRTRIVGRNRTKRDEYLVQWRGYPMEEADWIGYYDGDRSWQDDLAALIAFDPDVSVKKFDKPPHAPSIRSSLLKSCLKRGVTGGSRSVKFVDVEVT
jgi:hypothetical protein